ncbi:MAG: alpha-amylase family glycosyl hydrolase [Lachnospiraceae bacterium]
MKAKKFLAMLLSLAMILGSFTGTASASTDDGSTYTNGAAVVFSDSIYTATRTDLRDESIYYLMITRFYDGDSSNNVHCWDDSQAGNPDSDPAWRGDFKGLIEKLDYIKALGFTAVQLTPVAQNASGYDYHGYHPINLKRIDPRFESEGYTYQDLIEACHARELKVIQEVNFNSTSNFGEEFLCHLFDVDYEADLSKPEESLIPTKLLLDTYGLGSAKDYWAQPGGAQYQQRLNLMKNTEYSSDNGNSTGILPDAKDYDIGKLSSSDVFNPNNYYHSGYFQSLNWDYWTCKFCQIAGDCVDINTENPAVAEYLVETCKMYVDMGVDALVIVNARHIDRLTLNIQFIDQIKDLFRAKGKEPAVFLDVVTRYPDVWYRGEATESTPYYTWKESNDKWADQWSWGTSAEDVNNNMNLVFDHTIEEIDISDEPTSDNAMLDGITYHEPDYSMAGANVNDFTMHHNFGSASTAFSISSAGDKYFNDSTWNITFVDSYEYSPESPDERCVFSGGTTTWAENLCLMFTFRGIPRVMAGTEVEFQKGEMINVGPNAPLSETGHAYYGDNIEGEVITGDFSNYTASGTVAATLDSTLAKHIQKLNAIRRAVPALRKGQYTTSGDYVSGDMAFIRRYTNADEGVDSLALVTISGAAEFKNIPNGEYADAVTGEVKYVTDGTLSVDAPGKGDMRVYVCQAEGFTGLSTEFDVPTYTLSFDGNGAEGTTDSVKSNASGYVTLPESTFIAPAGKVLKAWEVDGTQYKAGSSVKITSDTTAKAVWKNIDYYGLSLGDTAVSELNKDNILGDGTASYNPDTFTLTLNGYRNRAITTNLNTLNIALAENSENTITATAYGICSNGGDVTISGNASLVISAGAIAVFANNVTISGGTIAAMGKKMGISAKDGNISIAGGILNVSGEKETALNAGGSISISDAHVTAVSYRGTALSKAPVLDGFTGVYKKVAGEYADGSEAVEYVSGDNELYKYFKVNPYYTASFMSKDGNDALYSLETESGVIVLPDFSAIGDEEGLYAYWRSSGKYYQPGAKLAIGADTEFVPVAESSGDTQSEDGIIYCKNEAGWSTVNAYYWGDGVRPVSWPGTTMENIEGTDIWKIADIPSGCTYIIFNNGSGTQTSDGVIPTDGNNICSNSTMEWSEYSPGITAEDTSGINIVSFSAGAGIGYMNELLNEGGEFKLPDCAMLRPENSEFVSWNVARTEYQPGDTVTISEDTVIVAMWNVAPEAEKKNGLAYDSMDGKWYYYTDGMVDTEKTGLVKGTDSVFWYVKNGIIDTSYTGFVTNGAGTWYVAGGKLDTTFTGLGKDGDEWVAVFNGKTYPEYTGLVQNAGYFWYVNNGTLDTTYTGFYENENGKWYVANGKVDTSFKGLGKEDDKWIVVLNGKHSSTYTGLIQNGGSFWYVKDGVLDTTFSGIVETGGSKWLVATGKLCSDYSGTYTDSTGTYTIVNGKVVE